MKKNNSLPLDGTQVCMDCRKLYHGSDKCPECGCGNVFYVNYIIDRWGKLEQARRQRFIDKMPEFVWLLRRQAI